jgi:hypothetical protein
VSLRLAGCPFRGTVSYDRIEGPSRGAGSNSRIGRLVEAVEGVPIDNVRRVADPGSVAVREVGVRVVNGFLTWTQSLVKERAQGVG